MSPSQGNETSGSLARHSALSRAVTKFFRSTTGYPAVLYLASGDDVVVDQEDWDKNFTPHCRQMLGLAREECLRCHHKRALEAIQSKASKLSRCHLGLWNQAVPIVIDGVPQAVILYGQMRRSSEAAETAEHRGNGLEKLNLAAPDVEKIETLHQSVGVVSEEKLATLNAMLDEFAKAITLEDERVEQSILRVVHDVLTRMQAVMALAENMQEPSLQPVEVRAMARGVLNETTALDATLQAFGSFMADYEWADLPIEPLIVRAREVYLAEAQRLGIKIQLALGNPPGPAVRMSKAHMQHALFNLVHNAVKYSFRPPQTGADRYVQIEAKHGPNGVTIVVSNYGIGILPDEYGKIFDDGYQGKLREKENRTGSGKGLSFVRKVIQTHRGTINVKSIQRHSAYINFFTLTLPHAAAR
jgi:signal transduction histidine kinase